MSSSLSLSSEYQSVFVVNVFVVTVNSVVVARLSSQLCATWLLWEPPANNVAILLPSVVTTPLSELPPPALPSKPSVAMNQPSCRAVTNVKASAVDAMPAAANFGVTRHRQSCRMSLPSRTPLVSNVTGPARRSTRCQICPPRRATVTRTRKFLVPRCFCFFSSGSCFDFGVAAAR